MLPPDAQIANPGRGERRALLSRIASPQPLQDADLDAALRGLLRGEWPLAETCALLAALRTRGESPQMILTGARVLRAAMIAVPHNLPHLLDTCGTGGDGRGSFNVSTAAALILGSLGVPVAKHGNRAVSSQAGSADVIEALGVPFCREPNVAARALREQHFAFLFAPDYHPALRHAAEARKLLGLRTLFNWLGPLLNPARANCQLIGVAEDWLRPAMASALAELGSQRVWVVRGEDGSDELFGCSQITEWDGQTQRELVLQPSDAGLAAVPAEVLAGRDAAHNAARLARLLAGADDPVIDCVLFSVAAGMWLMQACSSLREGAERGREALRSGQTRTWFEALLAAAERDRLRGS